MNTARIIEKFAPEMIDEIKARIHEGRWEISASAWTETDKNMPNGESLSRHILYTKRYLGDLFDIDPDSIRIDFSPDTFGHNWNCPRLTSTAGEQSPARKFSFTATTRVTTAPSASVSSSIRLCTVRRTKRT